MLNREVIATITTDDGCLHEFFSHTSFLAGTERYFGHITSVWHRDGYVMCSDCGKVWDTIDPCAPCFATSVQT